MDYGNDYSIDVEAALENDIDAEFQDWYFVRRGDASPGGASRDASGRATPPLLGGGWGGTFMPGTVFFNT